MLTAALAKAFAIIVLVTEPSGGVHVYRSQESFESAAVCGAAALGAQALYESKFPGAAVGAGCIPTDAADALQDALAHPGKGV